jgi:aldehyde dehydrogenase (NAD+)
MYEYRQFYIDGQWVDPVEECPRAVINPATESVIGHISQASTGDVDKAVAAAKKAFASYSQTSREERLVLLEKLLGIYSAKIEQMAEHISAEMGAPITLARTAQAPAGLAHIQIGIDALKNLPKESKAGGATVVKEPVGVCALVTPWNWPINQVACKVIPALAAGCTMVLKPSEIAPLDAYLFAKMLHEAGVPNGVFNLINGNGDVGAVLTSHPDVDMVSFTGSTRAGVQISKAAADTVKRVTLELGGKSANIIWPDADLESAVFGGVMACMHNTGQSCNAPTRMLVPREKLGAAIEIAKAAAASIQTGNPGAAETFMGPLSSAAQFAKVQGLIKAGIDEKAPIIAGGPGKPEQLSIGYFVKPTIFAPVNNAMTIAQEEIFGPVLCIIPYETTEDAIRIANDSRYGLAAYIQTGDRNNALAVASRLRVGNVYINGAPPDLSAPFGGYKQSGNGREWGEAGLDEYLEMKSIVG